MTISKICKRPIITYFCNQLSLALQGESKVGVESMAYAMKMVYVLPLRCNVIAHCYSTKCIFNMMFERFGSIKGKDRFTFGNRANQVVTEVTNTNHLIFYLIVENLIFSILFVFK